MRASSPPGGLPFRPVRPHGVAAGAARLPDLPMGSHRGADPRHVGLMRPASAGIRRLANAVVAAVFNIAIFGTGAAIYLFAVDLIMNTPTLPGWLQVVLVWLYRRGRLAPAPPIPANHPTRRQGQHRRRSPRPGPGIGGSSATCARPRSSTSPNRAAPRSRGSASVAASWPNRPRCGPKPGSKTRATRHPRARRAEPTGGAFRRPVADPAADSRALRRRAAGRPDGSNRTCRRPRRQATRSTGRSPPRMPTRAHITPDPVRGEVTTCGGYSNSSVPRHSAPELGVAVVLAIVVFGDRRRGPRVRRPGRPLCRGSSAGREPRPPPPPRVRREGDDGVVEPAPVSSTALDPGPSLSPGARQAGEGSRGIRGGLARPHGEGRRLACGAGAQRDTVTRRETQGRRPGRSSRPTG